jgi:hypothetical protein
MIDQQVFLEKMAILADRIGRELAGPTQVEYWRLLSERLTTEEFVAAMSLAFRSISGEYRVWPTVDQLVELIAPVARPTLTAAEAFETVLGVWTNGIGSPAARLEQTMLLGAATVRAFRAAGGRRVFENILDDEVKWAKRAFVECYTAAIENADAERESRLALATADEELRRIVNATAAQLGTLPTKRLQSGE